MYEDKRETFTVKDVILQLLFIVLLVFLLIWLFPTKGYLEQKLDGVETSLSDSLKPLYTRLFTDNIATMKDAAKSYYTTPRLPQNVGDTTKMTLAEMYQKGLLLELVDSNNNACDADKSYVELTKTEDEYQLKTTLSCSDKEAFVIEYLGCYDYCNGKLCSKATTTTTTAAKNYKYQYVLETGGTCGNYGSWSDWSENKIEENSNTKVDTKTEKVFDHYEQVYGVVDTKFVNEDYYEDVNFGYSTKTIKKTTNRNYWVKTTTKIASYAKKQSNGSTTIPYSTRKIKKTVSHNYWTKNTTVVNAYEKKTATKDVEFGYSTKTIKRTTTYAYSYQTVITGTKWVSAGRIETTSAKSSTDSVKYTFVSSRKELDCDDACKTVNYYTYDVEKAEYTTEKKKFCAKGTDTGSNCQEVTYITQNYCSQGTENAAKTGCVVTANSTVLYCTNGTDNGSGCAVTTSTKFCQEGTDTGSGCDVVTYETQNYCSQGTDNGSSCTVTGNKTVLYCTEGVDNGSGCTITTSTNFCKEGTDTGSGCQTITYDTQKYCSTGTDNGSGCTTQVKKTKQVAQLVYGYTNGDAVYTNKTYYRSKSKTCVGGTTDYQWSTSNNDTTLKSKGYTLTGATEEIK